jgi:hypothetical protein
MKRRVMCLVVAVGMAPAAAFCAQSFDLLYDVRVAGTGAKTAEVRLPGESVTLDLFVMLRDSNGDPTDEGIQSSSGSFLSGKGDLLGNISWLPPVSPFNATSGRGSQANQADLDNDGDGGFGWNKSIVGRRLLLFSRGHTAMGSACGGISRGASAFHGSILGRLDNR